MKTNGDIACWATAFAVAFALCIDVDRNLAETPAAQPAVRATVIPPIPATQLALYQKYIGLLHPGVKSWIEGEAQAERTKSSLDLAELSAAIHSRFDPPQASAAAAGAADALSGSEVAALSFLVILEMVQDSDSDLQRQMLEAEAQMAAKQHLRAMADALEKYEATLGASANTNTECATLRQDLAALNKTLTDAKRPIQLACPANVADVGSAVQTLQNDLDADNELSQETSLQLQMLMDTRSTLLQTASDLEKSMSDADMAIVGNIKQ